MKREYIEESYIYFASRVYFYKGNNNFTQRKNWEINRGIYSLEDINYFDKRDHEIKIGETASLKSRKDSLYYNDGILIRRKVKFEGTKEERLFIESYVRSKYSANKNMYHFGNDYFKCANSNTLKGAENKFFVYVAEAFEILSKIKNKNYNFECLMD
jgi:hypothetical protein